MRLGFQRIAARVASFSPKPPGVALLSREREAVARRLLAREAERIAEVKKCCRDKSSLEPGSEAAEALSRLAEGLIRGMRGAIEGRAEVLSRACSAIDERLPSDDAEHMDAPSFDEKRRAKMLRSIDGYAQAIGSYVRFREALSPLLREDGETTTVLDLASGHGGFPIALARMSDAKAPLAITGSDLRPEYVSMGRARGDALGLRNVSFRCLDATRLEASIRPGEIDAITSTQALHHFGAGGAAVLMAQAIRVARRGVLFIDLCRSASLFAVAGAASLMTTLDPAFVHDATLSVRRSFVPEELSLLAGAIPGGETLETGYLAPGFVFARSR